MARVRSGSKYFGTNGNPISNSKLVKTHAKYDIGTIISFTQQ